MNTLRIILSAGFLALMAGCSALPTNPVPLSAEAITPSAGRVGIAMSMIPAVDTFLPGASCLLCAAVAAGANSDLTEHARTLPPEGVAELKQRLAAVLEARGMEVVLISRAFKLDDLPDYSGADAPGVAKKDFRSLKKRHQIDKVVVIDISGIGFKRAYSAYVPVSDPKGWFGGAGYMVDLTTNKYDWYQPVNVEKSADGAWDEPPTFPGLTNAYFQALEQGKDAFLEPFRNGGTPAVTAQAPAAAASR